jgi:hypothetical protein
MTVEAIKDAIVHLDEQERTQIADWIEEMEESSGSTNAAGLCYRRAGCSSSRADRSSNRLDVVRRCQISATLSAAAAFFRAMSAVANGTRLRIANSRYAAS